MTDQNNSKANGRVIPAVAITGHPTSAALARLLHAVPAGAAVYAVDPAYGDLPDGVTALTPEDGTAHALARSLTGAEPGSAWVILDAQLEIPPLAVARLARIGLGAARAGVVSPLTNRVPELSPLPAGARSDNTVDAAWLDRVVYAAGRRAYYDVDAAPLDCAWWHPGALAELSGVTDDDRRADHLRAAGWRSLAADHLYIHDPRLPLEGPPIVADGVAGGIAGEGADEDQRPPAHPLSALRERVREALSARGWQPQPAGLDDAPVLLHVVHSWGGGVERFTRDLIRADGERRHLVLAAAGSSAAHSYGQILRLHAGEPDTPVIREWRLPVPVHSLEDTAPGYAAILDEIIQDYAVDQVLVSSLIGHSLEALRTGRPTAMVLHDYFPVCPALNIHFGEVCTSCREPRLASCLERNRFNRLFLDKDASGWLRLRERFVATILDHDVQLAVPTACVEKNLVRIEPRLADAGFTRIPHGLAPWPERPGHPPASHEPRLRLVLPGRIKAGKGRDLLLAALPALREVADIWLVGCGKDETADFLGVSGVHLIFDYQRDRLPALMDMIRPHAALLLSTVPETFSYTLSEMWSLDLPVVAVGLGALAERITDGENGMLVRPEPRALAEAVHVLAADPGLHARLARGAAESRPPGLADMARGYRGLLPLPAAAPCRYRLHDPDPALLVENALRESLAGTRRRLAESRAKIADQEATLLKRASWGFKLEKKLAERTAWARRQDKELTEQAAIIQNLQAELDDRTAWAKSLDAELARAVSRIQGLEHSLAELRGDYEAVLASRSWRMTRPLRDLTTFLRRVRDSLRFRLGRFRTNARRTARTLETQGVGETLRRANRTRRGADGPGTRETSPTAARAAGPVRIAAADEPVASIVIPVYNNSALTRACLASIAEHAGTVPMEVIVVDDESADDTPEMLAAVEGIRCFRNETNRGFIDSCNRGAEEARGEYLVILNNDTTVTPGWLESLVGTFEAFDDAGLVGAKLVYPDGRLQEAGGIIFNDASGWNYGRGDDPDRPEYNFVREADYCSGACIALRRHLFDQLGRFDERYRPAYYEDTDLAFKVREAGLRVYYQPGCTVIHHEGATSGTDTATGTKRYQLVNQKKFRERWAKTLAGHPAPGADIGLAREHRLKGRVLIVDAVTPQPDQDSGSLRMVNLMRLFRSLGYGVTFFPDNLNAPQPYTTRLQQLGVEMQHLPWLHSPPQWFADHGHRFDAVILSRHYVARNYLWLVRTHCPDAALLFDTVDLHFLRERRLAELEGRAALAKVAERTRREELGIARQSDMTLVVSPYEQEAMAREAPDVAVSVLSNIHEVHGRRRGFAERRDIWFVGGFQHPPNIDAMRWFTRDIWPDIRSRLEGVRFHIVGSKMPPEIQSLSGEGIEVHGFVPDVIPYLDGCRLAVAPLRYGAGVKGKVNQSMSYGQPVVATATALEGMHAVPGEDALVADDAKGFADAVVKAYSDESLWLKLSDNGLANVEQHFSFAAARTALEGILETASRREPRRESG